MQGEGGLCELVLWPTPLDRIYERLSLSPNLSFRNFRIKVTFGGVRKEDARLFAVYLERQASIFA